MFSFEGCPIREPTSGSVCSAYSGKYPLPFTFVLIFLCHIEDNVSLKCGGGFIHFYVLMVEIVVCVNLNMSNVILFVVLCLFVSKAYLIDTSAVK